MVYARAGGQDRTGQDADARCAQRKAQVSAAEGEAKPFSSTAGARACCNRAAMPLSRTTLFVCNVDDGLYLDLGAPGMVPSWALRGEAGRVGCVSWRHEVKSVSSQVTSPGPGP